MDDTISRQAAIDALGKVDDYGDGIAFEVLSHAQMYISLLPSAERRGRWEFNIDDEEWSWDYPYMCDQCREQAEKEFNFCPNCGARMEVE